MLCHFAVFSSRNNSLNTDTFTRNCLAQTIININIENKLYFLKFPTLMKIITPSPL